MNPSALFDYPVSTAVGIAGRVRDRPLQWTSILLLFKVKKWTDTVGIMYTQYLGGE
jgi:hypothetical protein